ncbi:MAG TPA: hypothetical protein VMT66_03465 [Steroidobacteraceae bacterium]|nr:hypothetical protein [Steroidobacteraceae bacterium]
MMGRSRSVVPEIPGWVGAAAMGMGLAAVVTAGALPERWQDTGLYLGVGLAFATVGGILLNLAMGTYPAWRHMATVIGIMLGIVPVLLIAWRDLHRQPQTLSPGVRSHPAVYPYPAVYSHAEAAIGPKRTRPVPQPSQSDPAADSAAPQQLESVLIEVSDILNRKAEPALNRATLTLRNRVHSPNAQNLKTQLNYTIQRLQDVRASLQAIQSQHPDLDDRLSAVIGDTAALDDLISLLTRLGDSPDTPQDDLGQSVKGPDPQEATAPAIQWIADCNRRIIELRKMLGTA